MCPAHCGMGVDVSGLEAHIPRTVSFAHAKGRGSIACPHAIKDRKKAHGKYLSLSIPDTHAPCISERNLAKYVGLTKTL